MARRPLVPLGGGGREGSGSGPSASIADPSRPVPSPVFAVRAPGLRSPPGDPIARCTAAVSPSRGAVSAPRLTEGSRPGVSPVGVTFLRGCPLSLVPVLGGVTSLWDAPTPRCVVRGCPVPRVPVSGVSPVPCCPLGGVPGPGEPQWLPEPAGAHASLDFRGLWGGGGNSWCFLHPNGIPAASSAGLWEVIEGFPLAVRQSCCPFVVVCFFPTTASLLSVHLPGSALLPLCPRTVRVSQCSSICQELFRVFLLSFHLSRVIFLHKHNQQILGGYHVFLACQKPVVSFNAHRVLVPPKFCCACFHGVKHSLLNPTPQGAPAWLQKLLRFSPPTKTHPPPEPEG